MIPQRLPGITLGLKIFLLLILTAIIPFTITNWYWYQNTQASARNTAESTLIGTTKAAANKVEDFMKTKLLGFLSHSQGAALLSSNAELIQDDLANFLLQDPDILSLSYVDTTGKELVRVERSRVFQPNELSNVSNDEAYKIALLRYGKEYIGPVQFQSSNSVYTTLAVPIVFPKNAQSLKTFSSSQSLPRFAEEVFGVLIGTVSLNQLALDISTFKIGQHGYVYLVDNQGIVMSHPEKNLVGTSTSTSSQAEPHDFLSESALNSSPEPIPRTSTNLTHTPVLSAQKKIARTGWAAIAEQPLTDITADASRIQVQTVPLFFVPIIIVILFSIFMTNKLVHPIQILIQAADRIGKGDFGYKVNIHTGDELDLLANAYQNMATNLQHDHASLVEEKNTLSAVLKNTDNGIVGLDASFTIIFVNTAMTALINKLDHELLGKRFDDVIVLTDEETPASIQHIALQQTSSTGDTYELAGALGTKKTIQMVVTHLKNTEASAIRYIVTTYDVSKQQELENMKLDFVSMAAHELRTPLTAIRGYLSVFIQENQQSFNGEQLSFLQRATIASQQLMALIENLLSVTKIERGVFATNLHPADWISLVKQTTNEFTERAKDRNIALSFVEPNFPIPPVLVDKLRITEVVGNLLSNAISYTYPDGSIKVLIEHDGDEVITHIQDTGEGIPKDALPKLFTKFFRVAGKLAQGSKGTGLGLYISKAIVEMHKGRIWVESEQGKGSTFSFAIPVATPEEIQKQIEASQEASQKSSRSGFMLNFDRHK